MKKEELILKGLGTLLVNGEVNTFEDLLVLFTELNVNTEDIKVSKKIDNGKLIEFCINNIINLSEEVFKDEYTDYIFFFNKEKCIFEYNIKTKYFYINKELIWDILEKEFNYNSDEIKSLIKDLVESYYKSCKEIIPTNVTDLNYDLIVAKRLRVNDERRRKYYNGWF